jgi:inositol 1,4,5-triphosphate receptor type 1/inositol 1,4,5-triphosphate receptor type 3
MVILKNKLAKLFKQTYFLILHEDEFFTFFVYLVFAFVGALYKHYFFSLHLFDIFGRLSLLRNVFSAISFNAKQLFFVAILGVLFIFVFSIIGFDNYVDEIY